MKRMNCKHPKSEIRRSEVIRAALDCFCEKGIAETSILEICRRSQTSVGSIYHHFKGKESIAAAVYLEGITDYQAGFTTSLLEHENARDGIFAAIRFHLEWVDEKQNFAKYLMQNRHAEFMKEVEGAFAEMNKSFIGYVGPWIEKHMATGRLKKLPPVIFMSILLGPCQEITRHRLSGVCCTDGEMVAHELGIAAWRALGIEKS